LLGRRKVAFFERPTRNVSCSAKVKTRPRCGPSVTVSVIRMGASMVAVSAHTIISRAAAGATLDFHENLGSTDGEGGMCLLVTGASGQLGSHLLRELRGNADLVAWSGSRTGELLGAPLVSVDLTNPPDVVAAFRKVRPEVVIHCAALSRIADCYRDPDHA